MQPSSIRLFSSKRALTQIHSPRNRQKDLQWKAERSARRSGAHKESRVFLGITAEDQEDNKPFLAHDKMIYVPTHYKRSVVLHLVNRFQQPYQPFLVLSLCIFGIWIFRLERVGHVRLEELWCLRVLRDAAYS